ncbi:MAG: glycoside hydrolase family 3 C-terminal domain-containing protein, partial [Oscillospiraceae bacterium]|nr:glycoside hydrolase family 3 C-terminal domain-containing protein [Oscillospiraceae bacterium]
MADSRIRALIAQMTLEEKAGMLSGFDYWSTTPVERLNIPRLFMADGPHGLRKQKKNELGIDKSYPATCFPTAALLACSWDEELAEKQGEAIGKEARSLGLSCVLGPGINIKRSPLCGRNFEYFSEDPLLSGRMGAGIVNGLQSRGVSACLKHFAVNNQEDYRFWVDAKVDERTLREIYLAAFEYALMYSKPKAMMCSYNKINGVYVSENRRLLTDILRNEWDYDGIVMSDWGAVNNRPQSIRAGLDLEMPGSFGVNTAEIIKAVNGEQPFMDSTDPDFTNTLTEEELDRCAERMLNFLLNSEHTLTPEPCDFAPHHELAKEIAAESMVLLENDGLLPLKKGINVAIVGELAKNPVYQGGGSSRIVPTKVDIPLDCIGEYADAVYFNGDDLTGIENFDAVIVFAGMPDGAETEGTDRTSLRLPEEQYELIETIRRLNKNIVTVLCVGAPVLVPDSPAVLLAYFGGQAMGGAVADLLFGVKTPCGKLAETFPCRIEETPAFLNFPGDGMTVNYGEGMNIGYRWYKNTGIGERYGFGYGLSYTKFKYSDLNITELGENFKVSVKVLNAGDYDGKEIVQLYINGEMKNFKKIFLKKSESKTITFELTPRLFSYWNVEFNNWYIEGGRYGVCIDSVGKILTLESTEPIPKVTMYTQVK